MRLRLKPVILMLVLAFFVALRVYGAEGTIPFLSEKPREQPDARQEEAEMTARTTQSDASFSGCLEEAATYQPHPLLPEESEIVTTHPSPGFAPPLPPVHPDLQREIDRLGLTEMSSYHTSFRHAGPSQRDNIRLAASRIHLQKVMPGEIFSYNRTAGPFTKENGYGSGNTVSGNRIIQTEGGGVCQISSNLYNAVLLSGLQVIERHAHSVAVPYVFPGRDAAVAYFGFKDFRFQNSLDGPVLILSGTEGVWSWVRLYGPETPPDIRIESKILERTPTWTERLPDEKLAPGEERLDAPGQDGVLVRTRRRVRTFTGETIEELGTDLYRPSPRIIRYGTGRLP